MANLVLFMLGIVITLVIVFVSYIVNENQSNSIANVVKEVEGVIDPCEAQYETCVHYCGGGTLSGLCKDACSVDRIGCVNSRNNNDNENINPVRVLDKNPGKLPNSCMVTPGISCENFKVTSY